MPSSPAPPDPALPAEGVVLVGPGRLGRTLALELAERGIPVRVYGRGDALPPAPLTLLTVPDRAIAEVAARVPPGGVVLHASGVRDHELLRPHRPAGSLHPLMTFPGPELGRPDLSTVPAAVAGDPEAVVAARALARALGMRPFDLPGDRRLYHAAAVVAGNFATVLLAEAAALLHLAGVPADEAPALLLPLARSSLENAARSRPPARALTGPVARGDGEVLDQHRAALLAARPTLLPAYEALVALARALAADAGAPPRAPGPDDPDSPPGHSS